MKKKPSRKIKGRALSKKRAARPYKGQNPNNTGLHAFAAGIGLLFGNILGKALDQSDQEQDAPAAGQDPVITEDAEFEIVEIHQLPSSNPKP